MFVMNLIAGVAALVIGCVIGFTFARSKYAARLAASEAARESEKSSAETQKQMLFQQLEEQKSASEKLLQEQKNAADKLLQNQKNESAQQLEAQLKLQQEVAEKQYEQLKAEFKVLAEKILAEKSADFEKNGKIQLDSLIAPLKVKLDEFKVNAEAARRQTNENNIKLAEQIQIMLQSSREIRNEANNLARALRSDNKLQGNWGEMILDEILASSGLIENVHYQKQVTLTDDDDKALRNEDTGSVMRPDVLVNYPDGKVVIVDSKVSLSAYVDYVNSENDSDRAEAMTRHLRSVKSHVEELVRKNYSSYVKRAKREAVEFVIMFMPNEGAYELAMRQEVKLWQEAFSRKVLIVSPVNLMALLQLIHLAWKRYDQERNQLAIIDTAGVLLDRLYGFYKEFDEIGAKLALANDVYNKASDKLRGVNGKHSVVKKGEELKALGVKMKKKMDLPLRLQSADDLPEALEMVPENSEEAAGE